MAMDNWNSEDLYPDGQAYWLTRFAEMAMEGVRELGLPSESAQGRLAIYMPTLHGQASAQRERQPTPPGLAKPSGAIHFLT